MTSVSCVKCGLVSWAAEGGVCKRCGTPAAAAPARPTTFAPTYFEDEAPATELAPPRTLGVLLTILGVLLGGSGLMFLLLKDPSPYFLVEGVGIAVSGVLIASGKRAGMYVYFATLALIVVWSIVETGGVMGQLMPRVFLPTIIGLHIAREKVRARLR